MKPTIGMGEMYGFYRADKKGSGIFGDVAASAKKTAEEAAAKAKALAQPVAEQLAQEALEKGKVLAHEAMEHGEVMAKEAIQQGSKIAEQQLKEQLSKMGSAERLSAIEEYGTSVFSKAKEQLIRDIAHDVARTLGVKSDFAYNASIEKVVQKLRDVVPNPKKSKVKSDKQQHVCRELAKALNKRYGRGVVDMDQTPQEICKTVGELVYSLFVGLHSEFLSVAGDVTRVVKNLNLLRDYVEASFKTLLNEIEASSADTMAIDRAQNTKELYEKFQKEFDRQLAILNNLMSVTIDPVNKSLISLLEDNEEMKGLVADLGSHIGTDNFAQKLGSMLSGVAVVPHVAHLVDKALQQVGLSFKEYKQARNFGDLRRKLYELLGKKHANSKQLGKIITAIDILHKNDYAHDDIVEYMERSHKRGSCECMGGADGGLDLSGLDADPDYNVAGRRFLGKKSLSRKIHEQDKARDMLFYDLNKLIQTHYQKIVAAAYKLAPKLGNEVPLSDALDNFITRFNDIEGADRENLHKALSGYRKDITSKYVKGRFMDGLEVLVESITPLEKGPGGEYFRIIKKSVEQLIMAIDNFNDVFVKALTEINVEPVTEGGVERALREIIDRSDPKIFEHYVTFEQAKKVLFYYFRIAGIRNNMLVASKELKDYHSNYENILGDEVAHLVDEINLKYNEDIKNADYESKELENNIFDKAKYPTNHLGRYFRNGIINAEKLLKKFEEVAKASNANDRSEMCRWFLHLMGRQETPAVFINGNEIKEAGVETIEDPDRASDIKQKHVIQLATSLAEEVTDYNLPNLPKKEPVGRFPDTSGDVDEICNKIREAIDINKERHHVYTALLKIQRDAKVQLYKTAEAVDLYLQAFTDGITANPDDLKDLIKVLEQIDIIARWFSDQSGNNLVQFFESFPQKQNQSQRSDGEATETLGNIVVPLDKVVPSGKHYYEFVSNADAKAAPVRVEMPATINPSVATPDQGRGHELFRELTLGDGYTGLVLNRIDQLKQLLQHVNKSVRSCRALTNLISTFTGLGKKFGDKNLTDKTFMSVGNIANALTDYIVASSICITRDPTDDERTPKGVLKSTQTFAPPPPRRLSSSLISSSGPPPPKPPSSAIVAQFKEYNSVTLNKILAQLSEMYKVIQQLKEFMEKEKLRTSDRLDLKIILNVVTYVYEQYVSFISDPSNQKKYDKLTPEEQNKLLEKFLDNIIKIKLCYDDFALIVKNRDYVNRAKTFMSCILQLLKQDQRQNLYQFVENQYDMYQQNVNNREAISGQQRGIEYKSEETKEEDTEEKVFEQDAKLIIGYLQNILTYFKKLVQKYDNMSKSDAGIIRYANFINMLKYVISEDILYLQEYVKNLNESIDDRMDKLLFYKNISAEYMGCIDIYEDIKISNENKLSYTINCIKDVVEKYDLGGLKDLIEQFENKEENEEENEEKERLSEEKIEEKERERERVEKTEQEQMDEYMKEWAARRAATGTSERKKGAGLTFSDSKYGNLSFTQQLEIAVRTIVNRNPYLDKRYLFKKSAAEFEKTDKVLSDVFRALAAKALTALSMSSLWSNPGIFKVVNTLEPARMIVGGSEMPEVITDAVELYIRLPLLAEWYREKFAFKKGTNVQDYKISMVPSAAGIWSEFIDIVFRETDYIQDGTYTDSSLMKLIRSINEIYNAYKRKKYSNRDIILAFVVEVNRRYGILKQSEINAYLDNIRSNLNSTDEYKDQSPASIDILDEEATWGRRVAPSDRYQDVALIKGKRKVSKREELFRVMTKFRNEIEGDFDNLLKMGYDYKQMKFSFSSSIRQAKESLDLSTTKDTRFNVIAKLIQGTSRYTKIERDKLLAFNELVVMPIATLNVIYSILSKFNYTIHFMNPKSLKKYYDTNAPAIPSKAEYYNYLKTYAPNLTKTRSDDMHTVFTDMVRLNLRNDPEESLNKIMLTLIDALFSIGIDLSGLAELKVTVEGHPFVDLSKLHELCQTLFNQVRSALDRFKHILPKDVIDRYDHKENGGIYWLEEHLFEELWNNRDKMGLSEANEVIAQLWKWLVSAENMSYDKAFSKLIYWYYDISVDVVPYTYAEAKNVPFKLLPMFKNGNYEPTLPEEVRAFDVWKKASTAPNTVPPDMEFGSLRFISNWHKLYCIGDSERMSLGWNRYSDQSSLLLVFNDLIARYTYGFLDTPQDKFYLPMIETLANGALADQIFRGKGIQDLDEVNVVAVNRANKYDSENGSVLFATLGAAIKSIMTAHDKQGNKKFGTNMFMDLSMTTRENMKANLPIFEKMSNLIIRKALFMQDLLHNNPNMKINRIVARNQPSVEPESSLYAKEQDLAPQSNEFRRTFLEAMLRNIISGTQNLLKGISLGQKELNDLALYMELSEDSIKTFKQHYNKLPLMPFSSVSALYVSDAQTDNMLHPSFNSGSGLFKMLYATRLLLANNSVAPKVDYMPGMVEIVNNYNALIDVSKFGGKDSMHVSKLPKSYANELIENLVSLTRFTIDVLHWKSFMSTFITGTLPIDTQTNLNEQKQITPYQMNTAQVGYNFLARNIDEVVALTENPSVDENIKRIVSKIEDTQMAPRDLNGRANLRVMNLLDMNIVPINVHAMQREIPLINLYNYSYTFERFMKVLGKEKTSSMELIEQLIHPYGGKDNKRFRNWMHMLVSGDTNLDLGIPKYISDELWNKVLLQSMSYGFNDETGIHAQSAMKRGLIEGRPSKATADKYRKYSYQPISKKGDRIPVPLEETQRHSIARMGRDRYDSALIRNLEWFANLQRVVRLIMRGHLSHLMTAVVKGSDVISRHITEYTKDNALTIDNSNFEDLEYL